MTLSERLCKRYHKKQVTVNDLVFDMYSPFVIICLIIIGLVLTHFNNNTSVITTQSPTIYPFVFFMLVVFGAYNLHLSEFVIATCDSDDVVW